MSWPLRPAHRRSRCGEAGRTACSPKRCFLFLTAAFVAVDRWRPPRAGSAPARTGALLLLGYIGVLSHVAMDWLNNYGVRLLMPFSKRWFYGDSIFIVDPWLWLTLAAGVLLARRASPERSRRAAIAVVIATAYVGAMVISARAARAYVMESWIARAGSPPVTLMVGPVLINPFRKTVILDAGDVYHRGTFTWFPRTFEIAPDVVPKHDLNPAVLQAQEDPRFQAMLVWARFPYYELTRDPDGIRVTLADLRFGPRLFNATTVVRPDRQQARAGTRPVCRQARAAQTSETWDFRSVATI